MLKERRKQKKEGRRTSHTEETDGFITRIKIWGNALDLKKKNRNMLRTEEHQEIVELP